MWVHFDTHDEYTRRGPNTLATLAAHVVYACQGGGLPAGTEEEEEEEEEEDSPL